MSARVLGILIAVGVLVGGKAVLAHHSFAAEFEADKSITLKGIVTKVEWTAKRQLACDALSSSSRQSR